MITTIYNEETISKEINTKWAGKTVHFAKETDSTNEWCKRMSKENVEHGTLAVAEFQSAGKGRLGRKWTAPEGSSVMMSILLKPEFEPQYASMLTLVMGLSVAQAVCELGVEVSIKWPNDIYWKDKKICGMLIENDLSGHNLYCSIIGIGINLNQAVFRGDAPNPVSLFQIIGKEGDREEVLHRFLSIFYRYYLSLLQEEYEDIRIRYQSALYRREGYHAYRDEAGEFEACIHDIESTGHLLLALRDGSIRRYAFKEVSYCK